jgi:hypothetical protein
MGPEPVYSTSAPAAAESSLSVPVQGQ